MPDYFLLEASCRSVIVDRANLCADDALEGLKHRTSPNSFNWIGPVRSLAEVHRVVVSIGESESNRHASGRLESQRIDQLLPEQAHCRRAENHDTLLVQADDPLIRPEIEQFCKVQVLPV